MWTQFVLRQSDVHIWDTWTINADEQWTHPCVCNYTSGYKSMRKVVQCIPLKAMAALAVLEDILNGAIGRERVLKDIAFAGTWWQLTPQLFWGQSSWNCAQSCGRRWSATQRGAMLRLCHRQCCQVYDNYRICTIILPCVRCTINNPKKGQIYDNFTILWMCGCNRL